MKHYENLTKEMFDRNSSFSFSRFIGILPNPDKILQKTGKTIEAYRELKNDPHVWSCIQSRKSGLLGYDYQILPNEAPVSLCETVKSFLRDLDVYQLISDALEAPLFGYQPFEIIWKYTGARNQYLIPSEIIAKPQEYFLFDSFGKIKYRKKGSITGEYPPEYKIILLQYEASFMNPYGQSLLSKCYWPVTFKNAGLRFWINFMERFGMPLLVGQYTRGSTYEESKTLARDLAEMTEDAVIVTPSDINIEFKEATRSSSTSLFKELIRHCNAEISKTLLSQTLTTELEMGSYAASMTHFKIRKEVIISDSRLVEKLFNELIRYFINLNYSNKTNYPIFKFMINDSDNSERLERDIKLLQTGKILFTKDYWVQNYGFNESDIMITNSNS